LIKRDVKEDFVKDIASHEIEVAHDSGIYRHLRFRKPQNSHHWFDIATYPGILTINGDMGTWTFSRVEDMFTFFRHSRGLEINASYWSEKLQNGTSGGSRECMVYNPDLFKQEVLDRLDGWNLSEEKLSEVKERLDEEVFSVDEGGEYGSIESYRRLYEFDCNGVNFDCELPDGKEYEYHFLWCLYAIVWAIQQYDKEKENECLSYFSC
jgi:hypothetical protein